MKLFPVVCCDGWQGWTWIETWKSWANFSKFSCYACKKTPQNVWYLLHISNGAFFCVGKGTKWWLWHRIDLKQQYPRDIAPLTLLSPNSDWTNINFLLTISRDCQEQSLWELIKWSQREKSLIFYQILPTNSFKWNVWRSVCRICTWVLGLNRLTIWTPITDAYTNKSSCLDFFQTYFITMEFLRQKTGLITDNSLGDEDAKLHS